MLDYYTLNKTPSRPVIAVDYSQKIELDINAKKLDNQTSYLEIPISLLTELSLKFFGKNGYANPRPLDLVTSPTVKK